MNGSSRLRLRARRDVSDADPSCGRRPRLHALRVPGLVPASVTPEYLSPHTATTCASPAPAITALASFPPVFLGAEPPAGGTRLSAGWALQRWGRRGQHAAVRGTPPAAPQGSAAVGSFPRFTPIPATPRHGCVTSRPLSVTSRSHTLWEKRSWKRGSMASGFTGPDCSFSTC